MVSLLPYRFFALALCACGSFLLTACSGEEVSRAFGLKRSYPDEYTVTTREPLSMPPSEDLHKPQPGAARPQERSLRQQALETLSPEAALQRDEQGQGSPAQDALAAQVSQSAAQPVGRREFGSSDRSLVDGVMFWSSGSDVVVDGPAENQRLQRNSALGSPATEGGTPTKG